jgi:hypothetical protein
MGGALATRIGAILGDRVVAAHPVRRGYSSTERWLVTTRGGESAFVKVGAAPVAAKNLRREAAVYAGLRLPCVPQVRGWDDGEPPVLVLADLSGGAWPPPWTPGQVDRALGVIESVHAARAALPGYAEVHGVAEDWWGRIAADPEPFLRLGAASRGWLGRSVEALAASAGGVRAAGTSVTHFDLRSDNFCFARARTFLVDWSHACLGNPWVDLGLFLPGLAAEGGPPPEAVLPARPEIAAWVAGFFAWHASKPHIPAAPGVRAMQRRHLAEALPWAARALRLEPPATP